MADIKMVDESGKDLGNQQRVPKTPDVVFQGKPDAITRTAVEQVMDLDVKNAIQYRDSVDILVKWAKQETKNGSPEAVKWAIRELEMSLGSPPISEKRVAYVARYAYLRMEKAKLEKEIESYTANSLHD